MKIERLVDLCDTRSFIRDRDLHDELLVGPAVLALVDHTSISGCAFDLGGNTPDALFIEAPEGKAMLGVIGLERTTITKCQFQNVSFIGTAEQLAVIRKGFEASSSLPPPAFYNHLMRDEVKEDPDGQK